MSVALDPRLNPEFQPGQLCVAGVISTVDLETGSAIYGRFERLEGLNRFARSPDYEAARKGGRDLDPFEQREIVTVNSRCEAESQDT